RDLPAMQIQATYHRHRQPPSSCSGTWQTESLPAPELAGFPHRGSSKTLPACRCESVTRTRVPIPPEGMAGGSPAGSWGQTRRTPGTLSGGRRGPRRWRRHRRASRGNEPEDHGSSAVVRQPGVEGGHELRGGDLTESVGADRRHLAPVRFDVELDAEPAAMA